MRPPARRTGAVRTRPRRGTALGLIAAAALVLCGCAGHKDKPTPAGSHVDAVRQVLDVMAEGLRARDATALASQWDPAVREAARERIGAALGSGAGGGSGPVEVRLMPVSVRAQGDRRVARVAWEGTWGGRPARGTFEMELSGDAPPAIVAIRGEDPVGGPPAGVAGATGTTGALGPALP